MGMRTEAGRAAATRGTASAACTRARSALSRSCVEGADGDGLGVGVEVDVGVAVGECEEEAEGTAVSFFTTAELLLLAEGTVLAATDGATDAEGLVDGDGEGDGEGSARLAHTFA